MNQKSPINYLCVIDDDEIYQFALLKIVEESKLVNKIITFYNGQNAITFFEDQVNMKALVEDIPDVIFLDLNMPVMDGWEFLENYLPIGKQLGKKVLVYVVSSSNIESEIARAKAISTVSDFIIKPVTRDHLIEIAQELATHLN